MAQYIFLAYRIDTLTPGALPRDVTAIEVVIDDGGDGQIDVSTDTLDGATINSAYDGGAETVTVDGVTITGITIYTNNGPYFIPKDGQTIGNGQLQDTTAGFDDLTTFPVSSLELACFTTGTLIATPDGPRPVESLQVGDLVLTADRGPQQIRWTGSRTVVATGPLAPVRFAPGAVGNDRELIVSPCHRMVLGGWRAEALFGTGECLVAARDLVNGDTIHGLPGGTVTYVHIMFDRHEIIFAEGAPSESFQPSDAVDNATKSELLRIFPELGCGPAQKTVRPTLKPHEVQAIAW